MGSERGQQATLLLKVIAQFEASRQSRQRVEAESRDLGDFSSPPSVNKGREWDGDPSSAKGGTTPSQEPLMGESLGRWRARGTLHHGGRPRERDSRAHRPPLHPPPPNSHPEALVLPTTGHSLAIGTPVDSIYLNRGGGQWCSEQGWGAGGRLQSPPLSHLPTRVGCTSSAWPGRSVDSFWAFTSHTFSVLSLLPLTRSRLSADHAIWYTAATWPRREARYLGRGEGNEDGCETLEQV